MKAALLAIAVVTANVSWAQTFQQEKTFSQSVSTVQKAMKTLPGGLSGPLPVLDGFVQPGNKNLDEYQRPYYKIAYSVEGIASGGSRVRVVARITAWHNASAKSGYEVLSSNGRLESDLLDRLDESLAATGRSSPANVATSKPTTADASSTKSANNGEPLISAPVRQFPEHFEAKRAAPAGADVEGGRRSKSDPGLQKEADNLEEILRNQAHPTNLVAVKKNQTPIVQNPALDAKVLFLASAEDEFEVLETNPDWVHIRISGLSRGWLRKSEIEFLDGSERPVVQERPGANQNVPETTGDSARFSISSEETGTFPGDWGPLKGKSVKIVSAQPVTAGSTSAEDKLKFAEEIFHKQNSPTTGASGMVVIFDSEDGGMIAATSTAIEEWKKGTLSEGAFWKQCFIDPPEILGASR